MSGEATCPTCGAPLEGGAPNGLCAVCLFGVGMVPMEADDPGAVDLIAEQPGDVVGRYVLVEKAGEGAFGVVFRAEQQTPMRRVVAVKIIKPGMDSKEVVMRFEAERQALAVMDHPHIAKVHDAGTTPRGRPFFVMEYVEGAPLTEFCDALGMKMTERLELFAEICNAVQHAHQKGIIHRDLKPGNILVSMDDAGVVTPKVIDFGVAKAISIELTEKTFFTVFGRMVGTPQYMSPEQTDLNAVDVDTRSDIYSLGVLLYELVTGHLPIESDRLTTASFDEMRRLIRELDPQKPSQRVANLNEEELRSAAEIRGMEPSKLRRFLSGDLDWIIMKALEKERGRRYDTAQGLANDVVGFLANEPVSAGPPGAAYRVRKFVRRHRVGVIAAVCVVLAVLGGTIGVTTGLILVRNEKNQKEHEHLKLLVQGVWKMREDQPGSREAAMDALGTVGRYDLGRIDLGEEAAGHLQDSARDALVACMMWTDLQASPLWEGLESSWVPAALDEKQQRGVPGFEDGRLEVRDAGSGKVLKTRKPTGSALGGPLRIDPKGKWVGAGFGTPEGWELVMWDWASGAEHGPGVKGVAGAFDFHPGGEGYVIGSPEGILRQIGGDGLQLGPDHALGGVPTTVRFRPDGKAAAAGLSQGGVALVDFESGAVTVSWKELAVSALAWAPEGSGIAVGLKDGSVMIVEEGMAPSLPLEKRHNDRVEQMAWSHDGKLIASGSRDEIRLWDGRQHSLLCEYPAWARMLEFSADDRGLGPVTPEADENSLVVLHVQQSPACQRAIGHPGEAIVAAAWVPEDEEIWKKRPSDPRKVDRVLVTGAADGLRFWNKDGAALRRDPGVRVLPGGIAATHTHLYLAEAHGIFRGEISMTGGRLQVGNAEQLASVEASGQIALSRDGKRLAVACDDEVLMLDAESGARLGSARSSMASTAFVALSPDGNWLAAGTRAGRGVRLWDLAVSGSPPIDLALTGPAKVEFYPLEKHPAKGTVLPPMLLTGDANAYRLWVFTGKAWVPKPKNGKHPSEMANPGGRMATMVFSPRGSVVVVSYNRNNLQVLHPTELRVMTQPRFDKQWPLAMSADGSRMATEAANGRMFIWDLAEVREELLRCNLDWKELIKFKLKEETEPVEP